MEKLAKEKEYYEKNKSEILEHKKNYRNARIDNNTDLTKTYCRKCNSFQDNIKFEINNKTGMAYKQCCTCRAKQ